MDSESGDTDNVSSSGHETCSTGTYTQKEKVRPKQLPVPVGVREFEGEIDDLVVADNVSGRYKLNGFVFNFEINVERFFCNSQLIVVFISKLQSGLARK